MASGGPREGAGRKHKYVDAQGNPLPTKRVSIPEIITEAEIQKLVEKLTRKENKRNKSSGYRFKPGQEGWHGF